MAATHSRYLGVTEPVSIAPPTPRDVELSEALEKTLQESGFFESEEESEKREIVLGKLNQSVKQFVRTVGERLHFPESFLNEAGGKIFAFGSYRLGVHATGADIDTLCVAPQHVERSDFFSTLYEMFEQNPEVTDLTKVPDAYVPVIKMKFSGISIDLTFARLALPSVPEDLDLLDHNLLKNLQDKCVVSLNGPRTTDEILRLVPNIQTFYPALRCIKLWAKKRALYSNSLGYLGGVAWALLVARVCQLYPNSAPSTIISKFFLVFSQWRWPQPVYLKPIEDFPLQLRVWNPRIYPVDRNHILPIITPAYPSMCSTHNVGKSTKTVILAELQRGSAVTMQIEEGKSSWADLFAPSDFFSRFRCYFQILATSESEANHRIWSSYMESKIRLLTARLELEPEIAGAPPYPNGFDAVIENGVMQDVLDAHFYYEEPRPMPVNTEKEGENEESSPPARKTIYSTAFYVGIGVTPPDAKQKGPRRLILDRPVTEFKASLLQSFDPAKLSPDMQISIRDIKRDNLPEAVFEGQPRPPKTVKRVRGKELPNGTAPLAGTEGKRTRMSLDMGTSEPVADGAASLGQALPKGAVVASQMREELRTGS